jgi:signal transduction histidine kinase
VIESLPQAPDGATLQTMDVGGRHAHSRQREPSHSASMLGLDELLSELIERAHDVRQAHERLRGLLAANRMIIGDLSLPTVLRRIVEAACTLVKARYGALGVIAPNGAGLQSFVTVGVDETTAAAIGDLPVGKGLLGALIDDPRPIRLNRLADHPLSVGFPDNHPPMSAFLGVPITVRSEVFGNLYLTEPESGEFTPDDEEVVLAMAATAGVAIENARLFAQSAQRQRWLQASMDITTQLLAAEGEEPLELIAREARLISGADVVTVVLPMPGDRSRLMVEVASSRTPVELAGYTFRTERTLSGQAIASGLPVMIDDASRHSEVEMHLAAARPVGPVMAVPFAASRGVRGALVVGRPPGAEPFDSADLDMATSFANHAAVASELADSRTNEQRIMLLEDRDRIARDLHDHVIQRLFAAGLSLDGMLASLPEDAAARIGSVVDQIDETIRQIRTSIFELRGHLGPAVGSIRSQLLEVVGEVRPLLAGDPEVHFDGPVDSLIPDDVAEDMLAVVREALTNVARHAAASHVEVGLAASAGQARLEICDDGVGLGEITRRSGLANLRDRAEKHGGTLTIESPATPPTDRPGTRIEWTVPLP